MKVEFHTSGETETIVERIREGLEREGFVFSEDEKSFVVRFSSGRTEKTLACSKFWSRKQLGAPHPASFSVEIEGEVILQEDGRTIVRADFFENHANRRHGGGGSRAIDEYVDLLCEIFRPQEGDNRSV